MTKKSERPRKIRYKVEPWDKPPENLRPSSNSGIRVSEDNYGYTDEILIADCLRGEDGIGEITSILLLSSSGGPDPSREVLEAVRDQINHHLEHHVRAESPDKPKRFSMAAMLATRPDICEDIEKLLTFYHQVMQNPPTDPKKIREYAERPCPPINMKLFYALCCAAIAGMQAVEKHLEDRAGSKH